VSFYSLHIYITAFVLLGTKGKALVQYGGFYTYGAFSGGFWGSGRILSGFILGIFWGGLAVVEDTGMLIEK